MSKEAFTPGPWYPGCHTYPHSKCKCTSILDESYAGGIATIHVWNGTLSISDGGNDAPPEEEAIANAHLIAEAPKLYKALKECLDLIELMLPNEETIISESRAALAKARGES